VLGDRLLGDVEVVGDLVDRTRLLAHQPQDRAAARLGQGLESCVTHIRKHSTITKLDLYKQPLVDYTSQYLYKIRSGDPSHSRSGTREGEP
jgi:hypothetical protein